MGRVKRTIQNGTGACRLTVVRRTRFAWGPRWSAAPGFTLIEMLAVLTILAVLAGLSMQLMQYAHRRAATGEAKSTIKTLEMVIENYRLTVGSYPTSSVYRVGTADPTPQLLNNAALVSQLQQAGIPLGNLKLSPVSTNFNGVGGFVIFDPYGNPYVYYRPATPQALAFVGSCSAATGGQMNPNSFDLFSCGADGLTYASVLPAPWNNPTNAVDDITNWQQ